MKNCWILDVGGKFLHPASPDLQMKRLSALLCWRTSASLVFLTQWVQATSRKVNTSKFLLAALSLQNCRFSSSTAFSRFFRFSFCRRMGRIFPRSPIYRRKIYWLEPSRILDLTLKVEGKRGSYLYILILCKIGYSCHHIFFILRKITRFEIHLLLLYLQLSFTVYFPSENRIALKKFNFQNECCHDVHILNFLQYRRLCLLPPS